MTSAIQLWTAFMICPDERRDERACSGLSDAFAERHPRPNHGASSHSLRRASPLRSGSAVRSTAVSVSSPRHNESHSGDSQLSLLAPATMNLVREIRSAGRRRRRRPGAATSPAYYRHTFLYYYHRGVARKPLENRDSGQTRGADYASHGYSHPPRRMGRR